MKVELKRLTPKEREWDTIGELWIDGEFHGFTLEDRFREVKIPKVTRIPAGKYPLSLRTVGGHHSQYLQKFGADFHKGMIQLQGVPNFSDILIHIGNVAGDTDGCILVARGVIYKEDSASQLMDSTAGYKAIYPLIRDGILNGGAYIEVTDLPQ